MSTISLLLADLFFKLNNEYQQMEKITAQDYKANKYM